MSIGKYAELPAPSEKADNAEALEKSVRRQVDRLPIATIDALAGWALAAWWTLSSIAWLAGLGVTEHRDAADCWIAPGNCMRQQHRIQMIIALGVVVVAGLLMTVLRLVVRDLYSRQVRRAASAWSKANGRRPMVPASLAGAFEADSAINVMAGVLAFVGILALMFGLAIPAYFYLDYDHETLGRMFWTVPGGGLAAVLLAVFLYDVGMRQKERRRWGRPDKTTGAYGRLGRAVYVFAMTGGIAIGLACAVVLIGQVFESGSEWWQFGGLPAALIIVPVATGLYALWWQHVKLGSNRGTRLIVRSRTMWRHASQPRFSPPDGVTPASVALLSGAGFGRQVVATLADLVVRGAIEITSPAEGTWVLRRGRGSLDGVPAYGQEILHRLVGTKESPLVRTVKRGGGVRDLYNALKDGTVLADLNGRGLISGSDPEADAYPLWWIVVAIATPLAIAFLFRPFIGVPLFVLLIAFCLTGSAPDFKFTQKGVRVMEEVGEFAQYLATAEVRQLQWQHDSSIITGYLPWVVALHQIDLWDAWRIRSHEQHPALLGPGDQPHLFGLLDALSAEWQ